MKIKIGPYKKNPNKKRKVKIKLDPYDTWSMDHTLSMIVVPMLKQLKETKHGAPKVDDDDVPDELKSTSVPPKEKEWDTDDNYFKRWDWVLDEMIWAHEQVVKDDESEFYDHSECKNDDPPMEQIKAIKVDKEGLEKYQARIDNGMRLFGKYYKGLWD